MDLKLTVYESFHKNIINRVIHCIAIPSIVWSTFVYSSRYSLFDIKLSFLLYLTFAIQYVNVNKSYSRRSLIFYYFILKYARYYYDNTNIHKSKKISSIVFVFSWLIQFAGHFLFENNRPALLDSFKDSITIAPLFSYKHIEDFIKELLIRIPKMLDKS